MTDKLDVGLTIVDQEEPRESERNIERDVTEEEAKILVDLEDHLIVRAEGILIIKADNNNS